MNGSFNLVLYQISIWAIPAIIAITFHEASHGYVPHLFGDDTAWRLGRVSFNPLVHIDPFGTVVLPVMLLMLRSPFKFGYAKPVPVNFRALRHPRLGTILVAAAGPRHESAFGDDRSAGLSYSWLRTCSRGAVIGCEPKKRSSAQRYSGDFQSSADPALDGGRILVGVLPGALARILSRAEPYGILILIGLIFVLPLLGAQLGINLDPILRLIITSTNAVVGTILRLTGNFWRQDLVKIRR